MNRNKKILVNLVFGLGLFCISSFTFATDKVVVLAEGWSTFSTPKILSDISFSNTTGSGITFYTLSNNSWQSVQVNTGTIKPLEGYMVYNANTENINIAITYESNLIPSQMLFSKNLIAGWNILGITSLNSPFSTIGTNTTMSIDFTNSNTGSNNLNKINNSFNITNGNANVLNPELGEAYGVYIQSAGMYAGSQDPVSGIDFERDQTVSLSTNMDPDTDNVVLMQGTITAKSAVNLEDVALNYTVNSVSNTGAVAVMNTVYLQIGNSIFSWTPSNTGATFIGSANVSGTVPVKMYTKLKNIAGTIKFDDLNLNSFNTKQYVSNQNNIQSTTGNIEGVAVTINTLNLTRTDGLSDSSIPPGSNDQIVYGARFTSEGNPVDLSDLSVTTIGTANYYTGGNISLTLYVDNVAKSTEYLDTDTNTVTFDNFNSTVTIAENVDIQIKANFSDVITSGTFSISGISYTAIDTITANSITQPSVPGVQFTIAEAVGTLAASSTAVNKQLLLSPSVDQKLVSFKVTATNDNIQLKDIVLTGTGFSYLSNIRLADSSMNIVGTASNVNNTGATFTYLDNSVNRDQSKSFYVIADINTFTDVFGLTATISVSGSTIRTSNGNTIAMSGDNVTSPAHDIAQNTFRVIKNTNGYTIYAFGKDHISVVETSIGEQNTVSNISIDSGYSQFFPVSTGLSLIDLRIDTGIYIYSAADYPNNAESLPLNFNY